ALVAPVGNFVADAEVKRAAAQVDPADEHAAKVAQVADVVAARAEGGKEFDGSHDGDKRPHGNHDGQREEPDLAIGKKDGVGDEDAENRAGSADGRDIRGPQSPKHGCDLHENGDDAGADATEKKVV